MFELRHKTIYPTTKKYFRSKKERHCASWDHTYRNKRWSSTPIVVFGWQHMKSERLGTNIHENNGILQMGCNGAWSEVIHMFPFHKFLQNNFMHLSWNNQSINTFVIFCYRSIRSHFLENKRSPSHPHLLKQRARSSQRRYSSATPIQTLYI